MFTDGRDHHQRMNGAIAGGLAFVSVLFQVYSLEPRLDYAQQPECRTAVCCSLYPPSPLRGGWAIIRD